MIVYGEILFAENMIIGGMLLLVTGQIHGADFGGRRGKGKLAAGSALCGAFALTIFLPVRMPVTALLEMGFAFIVCFAVFGKAGLWQKALTFLLVTYFFGGVTMALLLAAHQPGIYTASGIYTGDMKAGLLALFVGIALVTAKQIIRTVSRKKFYQEHVYRVRIVSGEAAIEAMAFLDTGNQLQEPVKGKPVAVADERLWQRMQGCGFLQKARFCVIPYESVGAKGLLEGVRVDYLELEQRCVKECVIAKSDGTFRLEQAQMGQCELLLSKDMADVKF